jgi:hypothetical protein
MDVKGPTAFASRRTKLPRLSIKWLGWVCALGLSTAFATPPCDTRPSHDAQLETFHNAGGVELYVHRQSRHKSVVKGSAFTRYEFSYKSGWMPWQATYADLADPETTVIRFKPSKPGASPSRLKRQVIKNLGFTDSDSVSASANPAPETMVPWVEGLLFSKRLFLSSWIKQLTQYPEWSKWQQGGKFLVKDYLEVSIRNVEGGEIEITLKPSMGVLTVHHSTLKPLVLHPWHMSEVHRQVALGLKHWNPHDTSVHLSRPILPYRLLMHPNFFLKQLRWGTNAVMFHFFMPYFMAMDFARGLNPQDIFRQKNIFGQYNTYQLGVGGFWVLYFLLEMLFYTPISALYESDHDPDEALWTFNFGDVKMTDWYFTQAQWEMDNQGITVIWIGMDTNSFWDEVGRNIAYFSRNTSFLFHNAVSVLVGEVTGEALKEFDVMSITDTHQDHPGNPERVIAKVFVEKEGKDIYYQPYPLPGTHARVGDHANVFKALFPMIRSIGCEATENTDACKIRNVLTVSHGYPGTLQNILGLEDVKHVRSLRYDCLSGQSCRGMPDERLLKTDSETLGHHVSETRPQFAFLACDVAKDNYGKQSVNTFADFFQLPSRHGRVVTSTKVVHAVFEVLPLHENSHQGRNQWQWHDMVRSSFTYGPKVAYRLLDRWFRGEELIPGSSEPSTYDLDFRE